MKYVYESITTGIFKFTVPGEHRTVELFMGSKVTVTQKLTGSYLRLLKLIEEIQDAPVVEKKSPAKKAPVKKTTTQKAKVADKITAVTETVTTPAEKAEVETKDVVLEVTETEEKPAPKRRGRKKKTS